MDANPKKEERKDDTANLTVKPIKERSVLKITNPAMINRMKYAESISPLKGKTKAQKKNEQKMTEEEKEINRKILYNMNLKLNFVKNPRYRENPQISPFDTTEFEPLNSKNNPFSVEPPEVIFRDYQSGCVYQINLRILNRTQLLTSFKYVPPLTENFSIKEVIYPKKDSALIAPGMAAIIPILFNATSMDNFSDEMVILTEKMAFKIPIKGLRDKPALSLSNPMDCKKCFIGDRIEMHFSCRNNGGDAHFRFYPAEHNESEEEMMLQATNELMTIGPFTVFPQEFFLYRGMTQNITVNFAPEYEGIIKEEVILVCENCTLNYTLQGEGIKVDVAIKELDGLPIASPSSETPAESNRSKRVQIIEPSEEEKNNAPSESNEDKEAELLSGLNESSASNVLLEDINDKKLDRLIFNDTFPHTSTTRVLVLQNTCSVPVKYHWSIYDKYHQDDFTMEQDEIYFTIEPEDGIFEPFQEVPFTIKFTPLNSKIYEQKLDLVIENIPFPAIKQFVAQSTTIKNSFTKAEPYLPGFNSSFPSYPLYSFNLVGRGRLPFLELNKNYIDFGNVYLGQEIIDDFNITNPRTGTIKFKVSRILQKIVRNENDSLSPFFKDNTIDDEIIFKKKIDVQTRLTSITCDINFDEFKNNYIHVDFDFLKLKTDAKNIISGNEGMGTETSNMKNFEGKKKTLRGSTKSIRGSTKTIRASTKSVKGSTKSLNSSEPKFVLYEKEQMLQIQQGQTIPFKLLFKPEQIGYHKGIIIFELDDGISFTIDVRANVIGPSLTINTPLIDFGLFSVSAIRHETFEIENTSKVSLKYLIKESRYGAVNLQNYEELEYPLEFQGEIREKDRIFKNKIETLEEYDNQERIKWDIMKTDSYIMRFSSVAGELKPGEKRTIDVWFLSPYPIHIQEQSTIEVDVQDAETQYINFRAQCEEAFAYIEDIFVIPKEIFLTIPIVAGDNTVTIVNPSNLPVNFKWDNVFEADHRIAEFEPNNGTIPPHSKIQVKYKIVYFYIDRIDELFLCHIEEMDVPLGINVQGDVIGLDIAYEFTEETYEFLKSLNSNASVAAANAKVENTMRATKRKKTRLSTLMAGGNPEDDEIDLNMKEIELKNLKVNSPAEITFKIKNLSGIPTQFLLNVEKYPPGKEKVIKIDKDATTTNISKLSRMSKKSKANANFKIDHLLLSATHEEINFTSPKGEEFTKQKQIEQDSILFLSNKKGVAVVIDPKRGKLPPHSEVLVKLSFFNESVGEFFDKLVSSVRGLPKMIFPIELRIKGNPLQLSPFQPGINYILDPPLLKLGFVLRNAGTISKNVKLVNIGANTIALDWKIYDFADYMDPKDRDIVKVRVNERVPGTYNLKFIPTEPHEFPPERNYFKIEPTHAVIGPKSTFDFTVTFQTDTEGQKNSLFIAYPKIEGDNTSKVTFNELPLKVIAGGLKPHLAVDKLSNVDGQFVYRFYTHSYGKSPRPVRSIILINKEKISMVTKIALDGPFRLERSEPVEASMGDMVFNIIPNSNLKLDIRFLSPPPTNEKEWPMTLVNEKPGTLTVTYENGETEIYQLKGVLKRPRILLSLTGNQSVESLDHIDFGYVNCASKKILQVYLMNETEVDTNWKINYVKFVPKAVYGYGTMTKEEKEDLEKFSDDPSVFNFDVTEGIIYGPSDLLINIPIGPGLPKVNTFEGKKYKPLTIRVLFTPKKNIFYKCRYKITTSTGNAINFYLKGFGSYLEEHLVK